MTTFAIELKLYTAGVRITVDPDAAPSVSWPDETPGTIIETSETKIYVEEPKARGSKFTPSVIDITVPTDEVTMNISTAAGGIDIGCRGVDSKVKAGGGDITAVGFIGSEIKTGGGNITVGEIDGTDIKTGGGDVHISRASVTDSCEIKTGGGDITIKSVTGADNPKKLQVKTGAGNVSIGIVTGTAAHLDCKSGLGDVVSELTSTDEIGGADSKVYVEAKTGAGSVRIHRA